MEFKIGENFFNTQKGDDRILLLRGQAQHPNEAPFATQSTLRVVTLFPSVNQKIMDGSLRKLLDKGGTVNTYHLSINNRNIVF